MFFYISFLRPPPTQIPLHEKILITPQISNDLRTEPYESSQDIYYSWVPCHETPQPPITSAHILKATKPTKLTTYQSRSAFKEIPVPAPSGVREGQQWQLILSSSTQITPSNHNCVIYLDQCDIGKAPFPVVSMPILFSGKRLKGNAKKQERVERIYQLSSVGGTGSMLVSEEEKGTVEDERARRLKITEQTSFDLDKKIWDSGIGLSSWLVDFRASGPDQQDNSLKNLWNSLFCTGSRNIVELGAGTGIVSLTMASLRSLSSTSQGDRIIASDLESAIPLLHHNISSNLSMYPDNPPEAIVLDWDDEELPDSVTSLENIDVVLMSDVTYNTASFPALLGTISKLLKRGTKPPVIVLGYKERDEAERGLWGMMKAVGVPLIKIGLRPGFAEPAIEVWTSQFVSSASGAIVNMSDRDV